MADQLPIKASAKKASEAERLALAIRNRKEQLERANAAVSRLYEARDALRAKSAEHETLISHLDGFYKEVDKLAKGKALFPATDMTVENANSIIRDAKGIIDGDVYIDRLKEFIPAGDNPVYPDVLMAARTIQQATTRFTTTLQKRRKKLSAAIKEAETVKTAIEIFVENEGHVATQEEIDEPTASWFVYDDDGEGLFFDFDRLDTLDISEHLTAILTAVDAKE